MPLSFIFRLLLVYSLLLVYISRHAAPTLVFGGVVNIIVSQS